MTGERLHSLSPARLLLVDDDRAMVAILKAVLRGLGLEDVVVARDGEAAYALFRRERIDVALVDFRMPGADGLEFVRRVRRDADSPDPSLPIVMLTAHADRALVLAARDAGVTEFCVKPVTAVELHRKLAAALDRPRDFVRTPGYAGPDRRRREERRAGRARR